MLAKLDLYKVLWRVLYHMCAITGVTSLWATHHSELMNQSKPIFLLIYLQAGYVLSALFLLFKIAF